MLTAIATSAYRAIMVCTSVAVPFLLRMLPIPYAGEVAGVLLFCWVDAYVMLVSVYTRKLLTLRYRYYCFESVSYHH